MKRNRIIKLALVIGLVADLFSTRLLGQNLNSKAVDVRRLALTGQTDTDTKKYIYDFAMLKDQDNRPEIVSVWFGRNVIDRIVTLLESEKDPSRNFCPDGIRIYYIADSKGTPYLKASIIIVSTWTDKNIQYPDQSIHRDYYEHDFSKALFKTRTDSLNGFLRNDDCNGGAKLYVKNGKNDCGYNPSNSNAVPISEAEDMVIRNKNHKHLVNTTAEWLPLKVFQTYLADPANDGVRIYFARRKGLLGVFTTGRNSFLLINTKKHQGDDKIHDDDLDCKSSMLYFNQAMHFDIKDNSDVYKKFWRQPKDTQPQDNGELCPKNCN